MIVAEIGLNHLGIVELVREYIERLTRTDIDAITLQVREKEFYDKAWNGYNVRLGEDIYEESIRKVHGSAKKFGIALGDIEYLDFFESVGADFYKVIRNDITNTSLIDAMRDTGKEIIVSTGLSSDEDINNFVKHIGNNTNFKLNHTQLSYDVEDCNLSAIEHMRNKYGLDVSFGSHCSNHNVLYMSLAYNPSDILFYVKFCGCLVVPDDKHAIDMNRVDEVIANLKILPLAVGSGSKKKMKNKLRDGNEKSDSVSE